MHPRNVQGGLPACSTNSRDMGELSLTNSGFLPFRLACERRLFRKYSPLMSSSVPNLAAVAMKKWERLSTNWTQAQEMELRFWRTHEVRHHSKEFWEERYSMFPLAPPLQGRVLEVGCGPSGAVGFLPGDFARVGIDPLVTAYSKHGLVRADYPVVRIEGVAEEMPFRDGEFNIVLCFNVLDHVRHPRATLREMVRVTKETGTILLWVHVLKSRWRPIRKIMAMLDKTHPHHMTLEELNTLSTGLCSLLGLRQGRLVAHPTGLKMRGANLVLESVYQTLEKSSPSTAVR